MVKYSQGKRPIDTDQMINNLIKEIVTHRKIMSNSNITEKYLDLLIKKFNKIS